MKNKQIEEKIIQQNEKRNKAKPVIVITLVVGFILLALFLLVHFYLSKINIVDKTDAVNGGHEYTTKFKEGTPLSKEEILKLHKVIDENAAKAIVSDMYKKDVMNILLIGSDMREVGDTSRSDTMILLSINKATKQITVTSLMRDIYLQIPGHGYNRLNAAYAYGGSQLVMNTIEKNFKLHVDKFVQVDFYTFMKLVDDLGGVTVDVNKSDIEQMNKSIREQNYYLGLNDDNGLMTSAGRMKLNGKRTLAYVRNRYYYDGDFTRTEHQRQVVAQLSDKVFALSLEEANRLLCKYLPLVSTNLSEREMFSLLLYLPEYAKYDINQICVPSNDTFSYRMINKMSILQIDFQKNIDNVYKNVYGEPKS